MSENLIKITDDMFEPLDESEKNSEFIAMESKTFFQDAWNKFRKNKMAVVGLIFLTVTSVLAILVPMLSKVTFDQQDIANKNLLPSLAHPFGTDKLGRDIFVRIFYGARVSLSIGFATAFVNLIIGIIYGGIA
ncbi:MAG: ABC transporter permease, partial [Erysipelotrichaceae bacterium]|nr:ABC transporter permease [Erysipelotrichaceae bacterium]